MNRRTWLLLFSLPCMLASVVVSMLWPRAFLVWYAAITLGWLFLLVGLFWRSRR